VADYYIGIFIVNFFCFKSESSEPLIWFTSSLVLLELKITYLDFQL